MYSYLKSFSVMGYIKLAFAGIFIITGVVDNQISISILGGVFFVFTLLNKGACPGGSCSIPQGKRR